MLDVESRSPQRTLFPALVESAPNLRAVARAVVMVTSRRAETGGVPGEACQGADSNRDVEHRESDRLRVLRGIQSGCGRSDAGSDARDELSVIEPRRRGPCFPLASEMVESPARIAPCACQLRFIEPPPADRINVMRFDDTKQTVQVNAVLRRTATCPGIRLEYDRALDRWDARCEAQLHAGAECRDDVETKTTRQSDAQTGHAVEVPIS